MDFSVIRPKPPKKSEPPPPKPPPPAEPTPPPPPAPAPAPPPPPYMEDLDHVSRMQRLRSIEYTNSRVWRMNFGDYYGHHGNYEYARYPFGAVAHGGNTHYDMVAPPPPGMSLPPLDYYHAHIPAPPQRLALPPPDYHHGPPGLPPPHPGNFYYPPPPSYGGGFFYDENPNACRSM